MDSDFECGACGARFRDHDALDGHERACEGFLDLPFGEIAPTGRSELRPAPTRRQAVLPAPRRVVAIARTR